MKNAFYLSLPVQKKDANIEKMAEKSALEAWVNNLPKVDVNVTRDLVIEMISKMNATNIDAKTRLSAMEMLHPLRKSCARSLRHYLMGQGFPKTAEEISRLTQITELDKAFSTGYWACVKVLSKKGINWFNKKHVALAINRVIVSLSHIIVNHEIMHKDSPSLLWVDLHAIYQLACSMSVESLQIDDSGMSIIESYKQILLFSLLDSSLFTASEIVDSYTIMREISPMIRLSNKHVIGQRYQCIIPIEEDRPPQWMNAKSSQSDTKVLYIASSGLSSFFSKKRKYINDNKSHYDTVQTEYGYTGQISDELMHYLELMLYGEKFVGTPLFNDRLPRYCAIGVKNAAILKNPSIPNENKYELFSETASGTALIFSPTSGESIAVGTVVSFRREDTKINARGLGIVKRILVTTNKINFEIQLLTLDYRVLYVKREEDNREDDMSMLTPDFDSFDNAGYTDDNIPLLTFSIRNGNTLKKYLFSDFYIAEKDRYFVATRNSKEYHVHILGEPYKIGLGCWQYEYTTDEEIQEENIRKYNDSKFRDSQFNDSKFQDSHII